MGDVMSEVMGGVMSADTIGLQLLLLLAGLFYGALVEYSIHRFLFHDLGRAVGGRMAFHWRDHHGASRRQRMMDPAFASFPPPWSNGYGRELYGLMLLALLHAPLVLAAPGFYLGAMTYGLLYHYVHRRSHLDPAWAMRWIPWHVEHHLGRNQDRNFGVVTDLIDRLVGTWTPPQTERLREKLRDVA